METDYDVIVVGAGPVGLTAAGDLARAGRRVAVLERWPSVNPASRAFAVMARTLEVLDARGLAEEVLAQAARMPEVRLFADAHLDLSHLDSAYRFVAVTPQTRVDAALAGYAERQGAHVVRGVDVVDLTQDADGVTLTTRPFVDGAPVDDPSRRRVWRAAYAVGADGAHSAVRERLGVAFPGRTVLSSVVLADVRLTDGPHGGLTLGLDPDRFGFVVPYERPDDQGGEWYRTMTWDRRHQVADDVPVDVEREVAGTLRHAMGRDLGVAEVAWRSRFHCDERQVVSYRAGRVFLAGDAAHVHSPMGGQGMNTGIQDAANLAWKLAAVLDGAPGDVLDTYQSERHPIGRRVLLQSGLIMRAGTLHPRLPRFLRDHVAPPLLRRPAVRDLVAGSFAGTGLRYAAGRGESRLVGTRAAAVPLAEGPLTRLQCERPGFVLVDERDAEPWAPAGTTAARRLDAGPALLVRPDGHVAWAGTLRTDRGRRACAEALGRWSARTLTPCPPVPATPR